MFLQKTVFEQINVEIICSATEKYEMEVWAMPWISIEQRHPEINSLINNRKWTKRWNILPTGTTERMWEITVRPMSENERKSESCIQLPLKKILINEK